MFLGGRLPLMDSVEAAQDFFGIARRLGLKHIKGHDGAERQNDSQAGIARRRTRDDFLQLEFHQVEHDYLPSLNV